MAEASQQHLPDPAPCTTSFQLVAEDVLARARLVLDDWTDINEPKNEAVVCEVSEEKSKEVERQKRSGVRKLKSKTF